MLLPIVRQMILCEDARPRKGAPRKIDVFGLLYTIDAPSQGFPIRFSFTVYLCFTSGRGRGLGKIIVIFEETEELVYVDEGRAYYFGTDPLAFVWTTVRIPLCVLSKVGMYLVRFVYNETMLSERQLLVREMP